MKKTLTINIPSGTRFLSDVLKELPKNALFNKGKPGCGGTTIALSDSKNYIIAVPTIHLAQNKAEQTAGAFAFTGGTSIVKLKKYLQRNAIKKILVTYDSLPKLIDLTGTTGYHLLIDEYHLLFTQYSFREQAIKGIMDNFKRFDSYTFMTATPLESDFILEELIDIDLVAAEWEEPEVVIVQSVECSNVLATVMDCIKAFLEGTAVGNAYFFINSVDFINTVIKRLSLTDNDTRVICSPNNEKEIGLKKSSPSSAPKKINLLTSTCFEGVDLYDVEGKTFVVSDGKRQHTLIDISTSLPQITGRIRNTKYKDQITHLYSTTAGATVGFEDYKKSVNVEQRKAQNVITELNSLTPYTRAAIKLNLQYVSKNEKGEYFLNNNQIKQELYNYKIKSLLYSSQSSVTKETQLYGFTVKRYSSLADIDGAFQSSHNTLSKALSLKDIISELDKPGYKSTMLSTFKTEAFDKYPFLSEAIEILGFQGIKECNFKKSEIEKRLIIVSNKDNYNKIIHLLDKSIKPGTFVSSKHLKNELQNIYGKLKISLKPIAADINKYYDAKETVKKINNRSVKGFLLASKRMVSDNSLE